MHEVRRYSDKTIKIAARCLRRAVREMAVWDDLSLAERIEIFVGQLMHLSLQPIDLTRASSYDAMIAIAQTIQKPETVDVSVKIDTETGQRLPSTTATRIKQAGKLVIDSCAFEYMPGKYMARRTRRYVPPNPFTHPWQRVIDRVLNSDPSWLKCVARQGRP